MPTTPATIQNGANIPVNFQQGTVPNMMEAMRDWFQILTFTQIVKTVVGFEVVETPTITTFRGVVMPYSERTLYLMPEGERAWTHIQLFTDPVLKLQVDDVVNFLGKQTRVMGRYDFSLYSYVSYHLIQDWEGSGP